MHYLELIQTKAPENDVKMPPNGGLRLVDVFLVEFYESCGVGVGPAVGNVGVVLVGNIGVPHFHRRAFFVRVKLNGYDGLFLLLAEVPLLYDLFAWLEFEVLPGDTFIPHAKLRAGHGRHRGLVAGPQFYRGLDGEREVYFFGWSGDDVVFFKVFHVARVRVFLANDRVQMYQLAAKKQSPLRQRPLVPNS